MGEYALINGVQAKIGTCEDLYYLRRDQRHLVHPLSGNVDVHSPTDLAGIRFRFPFPDEDHMGPGEWADFDRAVTLHVPGFWDGDVQTHGTVQFASNHPKGYLVSLHCPERENGSSSDLGLKIHRNGHPGNVRISQQALRGGLWKTVLACGGCGRKYRFDLDDLEPVLAQLGTLAGYERRDAARALERDGTVISTRAEFYDTIAERIREGYAERSPNAS